MTVELPPLCEALPYDVDSREYYELLRHLPWPVLLDSNAATSGRYDIISADPFITLETHGEVTEIHDRKGVQLQSKADPFMLLQQQLQPFHANRTKLPFAGGAIGYFAYDLGRRIEKLPSIAMDAEHTPEMAVGIYDWAIVRDHHLQQCWLVSFGHDATTRASWTELCALLKTKKPQQTAAVFHVHGELRSNLAESEYKHAFDRIKNYIREGDCYQVNLAKRFEVDAEGDPWQAYKLLRQYNPAPFAAYISTPSVSVLSSSPERLLEVDAGQVETKPIKGTRPRDLNNAERDQKLAEALQTSVKDRAENLMIVDLLRNDLGKVCKPGSIAVPQPFALESFATVHHLVSTITGELASNETAVSLLRACFPGGSITGAPKLRAMEIIEELEPHRRGVYCGSIGYIGFDGNMDSNITIRTMVFSDGCLRFWAGGGIVHDSQVESEYQEVLDKAAAMLNLVDLLR